MSVIIGNGYCSCLMTLFSQCELLIQRTLLSFFGMVNEDDAYSLSYCGAKTPSPRIEFLFESLQMDSRYWVRHRIHRLGILINVKVYLLCGCTSRVSSNIFLFSCSTQSKSAFWCAFRWVSPLMTSATSVFSYWHPEKAFESIFTKELVFYLDVKHVFRGIEFVQIPNLEVDKVGWTNQTIPCFLQGDVVFDVIIVKD
jgi:hypothetical protein